MADNDNERRLIESGESANNILEDLSSKHQDLIRQTQNSANAIINTYAESLKKQRDVLVALFKELEEKEKQLSEEYKNSAEEKIKLIEEEKRKLEELYKLESERAKETEDSLNAEKEHQAIINSNKKAYVDLGSGSARSDIDGRELSSSSLFRELNNKKDKTTIALERAEASLNTARAAMMKQKGESYEQITDLNKQISDLEEEAKTANDIRLEEIELEKARLEEQRVLEEEKIRAAEEAYQAEVELQKKIYDNEKARINQFEYLQGRIDEIGESTKDQLERLKGSVKDDWTRNGAKNVAGAADQFFHGGLKASQINTGGYESALQGEQDTISLLKKQLSVAEGSQKNAILAQIQEHEDNLKQIAGQKNLMDALNNLNATFVQKVDEAVKLLENTELKANTRLMGSNKQFSDKWEGPISRVVKSTAILDVINKNLAASPFVKTEKVIEAVAAGISQGIVTNVELRGFLNSIKEGLVDTFDAFDEKISRLIRIQQRDSTVARMGMEASLMKLYNQMFETSEYLQSGFDSVTDAIYEASAIVSASQAEEMEFVMQKWLGSLYSVGMSQSTITGIATAISQIASGDVSQVGSGAQNLVAMALSRAGLSYDQIFTSGITPKDLNTLMQSIVLYLQDIAETSQNNNVVQKELGNVFGVSISDIRAATNLTAQDIASLTSYAQSYTDAEKELNSQLQSMIGRMSSSVLLSNIYDNFMLASGMTVAENPVTYFMQKILGVLPNMEIPMPQVMGSGISAGIPLKDILQTALTGFGLIGGVINAISSIGAGFGTDLNNWNASQTVTRGAMNVNFSSGFTQTTSGSQYASSGADEDLKASAMGSAKEQSEEGGEVVGTGDSDTDYTSSNIYKLLTGIDTSNEIVPMQLKDEAAWNNWFKKTYDATEGINGRMGEVLRKLGQIEINTGLLNAMNSTFGAIGSIFGGNNKEVTIADIDTDNNLQKLVVYFCNTLMQALSSDLYPAARVEVTNIPDNLEGFGAQ